MFFKQVMSNIFYVLIGQWIPANLQEVATAILEDTAPIASYADLIRMHGLGSPEANAFFKAHKKSRRFVRLARGFNSAFLHRNAILHALESKKTATK
jgi:hypothetical protein